MATPQRVGTKVSAPSVGLNLRAIVPWAAILGLVAVVLGGLAVDAGVLIQLYPLATFAVGVLLYWRHPPLYLGFTWWLWFLTPEVRRLVDYQEGWAPENPIMLAPLLVTALAFLTVVRHLPKLQLGHFFPFGLVFLGLGYSYLVGFQRAGLSSATYDLLLWLIPVVFSFHLIVHWRSYPRYRRVIQRTFVWGVLVTGVYGLLQFFYLPDWDRYWMVSSELQSIGDPEPLGLRVFSTLNSPGPFAVVLMAGLLLLLSGGGPLRWPAAGVGYASLLLSLVRSAWGAWLLGLIFLAVRGGRSSPRLLVGLLVAGLIALPLVTIGPVAELVEQRLETVTNLQEDDSAQMRQEFYVEFARRAFFNPVGEGLGTTGLATRINTDEGDLGEFGSFDSGIMNIPFVLGWIGSLLYLGGLALLLPRALLGRQPPSDLFAAAARGIALAMLAQLVFSNSLVGVTGLIFWSFLGLASAATAYHVNAANVAAKSQASDVVRSVDALSRR